MSEQKKTLGYDWEFGHEEITLRVSSYMNNKSLYIGMLSEGEDGLEPFADMTVNLPESNLKPGEAYLDDFAKESKLQFIKKHKLGKLLPEKGRSGYVIYDKVVFDLEKLREFDREGVDNFKELHGIREKENRTPKRKSRDEDAR